MSVDQIGDRQPVAVTHSPDAGRDRWTAVLITTVWAWSVVPRAVQSLTGIKFRGRVGVPGPPLTPLSQLATLGLTLGLLALCGLIILGTIRDLPSRLLGVVVVLLLPWSYLVARDLFAGLSPDVNTALYPLIIIAFWMLRPKLSALALFGKLVGLTAMMSILLGLFLPSAGLFRTEAGMLVSENKEILPLGVLVGVFTHGNNLGQFLVLGLPTVFLIERRSTRLACFAAVGFCLVWSASRAALVAAGLVLLVVTVVRLAARPVKAALSVVLCGVMFSIAGLLPFVTSEPVAFTNRGLVWMVSLEQWRTQGWFGLGSNWYGLTALTSNRVAGTVFHGHNQLVHLLVTGGLVFAIAVLVMLVTATGRAAALAGRGELIGVGFLTALAGTCFLEVSLGYVDNFGLLPAVVVPLAVVMLSREHRELGPTPTSTADRRRPSVTATSGGVA